MIVKQKRVLIVYAQTGAGHKSVAHAISEQLAMDHAHEVDCQVVDLFRDLRIPLLKRSNDVYRFLISHAPWLYDLFWKLSDEPKVGQILERIVWALSRHRVINHVRRVQPDLVVVVHPLYIVECFHRARIRTVIDFPIAIVVTDPVTPHASWGSSKPDLWFVPTKAAAERLRSCGAQVDRTVVAGYPIRSSFRLSGAPSRAQARYELGIPKTSHVAFFSGGGNAAGRLAEAQRALRTQRPGVTHLLLDVNSPRELVTRETSHLDTFVAPFVDNPVAYYAACDVIIGKAGPSTIFEAGSLARPLILIDEVGRQEFGNSEMAARAGLGISCGDLSCIGSSFDQALKMAECPTQVMASDAPTRLIASILWALCVKDAAETHAGLIASFAEGTEN